MILNGFFMLAQPPGERERTIECKISDAALSSSYWKVKLHSDEASTSNAYVVGRIPKSDDELASYLLATIEANRYIRVAESCAIPETTIR